MKAVLSLCLASLALTGCATTTQYTRPPDDKLICDLEPDRPVGKGPEYIDRNGITRRAVTDEENGAYLRSLRATGQSCREDVNWLRVWFDKLNNR